MAKTPMDFETFKYYMDRLKEEYDWREACAKLDINVGEHMDTFYYTVDLLEYIFNDKWSMISWFIFEGEWGTNSEYCDIHSIEELYDTLVKGNNNEHK